MKKSIDIFFLLIGFISTPIIKAQDYHFSNPKTISLSLNPALAGTGYSTFHISSAYRSQWTSVASPFTTIAGNADIAFLKDPNNPRQNAYFGTGLDFYSDKAGDANMGLTQVNLSFSATVPLDDYNYLSAGIQGGLGQRKINFSNLYFANQYTGEGFDNTINSGEINNLSGPTYADLAAGVVYHYNSSMNKFWENNRTELQIGISTYHLTQPQVSLMQNGSDKLYRKYVLFSSLYYDIANTKLALLPALYYFTQGPHSELLFNFYLRNKIKEASSKVNTLNEVSLYFGLSYRHKDALIPSFGLSFGDFWINAAFDVNISSLSEVSRYNGAMEFTLRYNNLSRLLKKAK